MRLIVTGTDTGVGKTVVSAMLTLALDAWYWKPIQSGLDGETDTQTVARLTGLPPERQLPEAYRLHEPLSPHRSAELDHVQIDPGALTPPDVPDGRLLIIEGAGGVFVPVTRSLLQVELFARWNAPAIVVARTALGTINHTLLTVDALRRHHVSVSGIIFTGEANPDTQQTIADFAGARVLGRIPPLKALNAGALREVFARAFDRRDFVQP